MNGGSSFWLSLLKGLIDAWSQYARSNKQKAKNSSQGSRARDQRNTGAAVWRSQSSASTTTSKRTDLSPGRAGRGATRDLTPAELSRLQPTYSPARNGEPDPGEVIWTWVPYAEHDGRGKDRPVLIIARVDSEHWAACYLSTKHHDGFISVGSGPWDSQGRESFLSPERILLISEEGMRRESTGLNREAFERAVDAIFKWHGISAR